MAVIHRLHAASEIKNLVLAAAILQQSREGTNSVHAEIDPNFLSPINGTLWHFFKVIIEINRTNYAVQRRIGEVTR
ncbi:Uncharacterised protein [Vibrio cholerae]|nr:Uncharacterised protein [Vibrio cholerae]